ncbi:zinc finger and BTB domain-containing protein 24-like [Haliotis cracherodii]|uniref:zinc finger and BTB domain-containing protein 24-like n=1 Tax=Haliotis cracherodii TaxID=6455 RepID=UPI0039EC7F22
MAEESPASSSRYANQRHECEICHKVFYRNDVFKCHMRIHSGIKPYPCDVCGKRFAHYGNRNQHAATHITSASFKCEMCGKSLTSKIYLNRHMKKYHPDQYTPCKRGQVQPGRRNTKHFFTQIVPDVTKQTESQDLVTSNEVRIYLPPTLTDSEHKDSTSVCTNEPLAGQGAVFQLTCSYCGEEFEQRHRYQLHIMMHELEQGKTCSFCHTTFSSLAEKRKHEMSHTEKERNIRKYKSPLILEKHTPKNIPSELPPQPISFPTGFSPEGLKVVGILCSPTPATSPCASMDQHLSSPSSTEHKLQHVSEQDLLPESLKVESLSDDLDNTADKL